MCTVSLSVKGKGVDEDCCGGEERLEGNAGPSHLVSIDGSMGPCILADLLLVTTMVSFNIGL